MARALLMQVPVHSEAAIDWEPLPARKHRVRVHMLRRGAHIHKTSCETTLPLGREQDALRIETMQRVVERDRGLTWER